MNKRSNKTLGILALVLGIIGLVTSILFIGLLPSIAGLVLGIVALVKRQSKGLSIVGIICSAIGILVSLIIFISVPSEPCSGTVSNMDSVVKNETDNVQETLADMIEHEIYAYTSYGDTIAFVLVKNNSDVTIDIDTNVKAVDSSGNIISAYSSNEMCIAPGQSYPIYHYFEGIDASEIANYDYTVTATKSSRVSVVDANLPWSIDSVNDNGVLITVTNNHDYDVSYLYAYSMFFNDGEFVGFGSLYIDNISSDCILQSGQTVTKQIDINSSDIKFTDAEIYLHGYVR